MFSHFHTFILQMKSEAVAHLIFDVLPVLNLHVDSKGLIEPIKRTERCHYIRFFTLRNMRGIHDPGHEILSNNSYVWFHMELSSNLGRQSRRKTSACKRKSSQPLFRHRVGAGAACLTTFSPHAARGTAFALTTAIAPANQYSPTFPQSARRRW